MSVVRSTSIFHRSILAAAVLALVSPMAVADEPRKVTLRGKEFSEYPLEKLRARGIEIPDVPDDRNAALVYIEAYNARKDLPQDLQAAFDQAQKGEWPAGEQGERLGAWLDENRSALDLARRAAAMPQCRTLQFGDGTEPLYAILLPTLQEHRQIVRMLAADAARQQAEGQASAALDDALVMQRMANHVGGGWTLIEHLVGVACAELGGQTMVRVAKSPDVDAAALGRTVQELETLQRNFPSWERAMRAEEIANLAVVDDLFTTPGLIGGLFGGMNFVPGIKTDDGWGRLGRRVVKLFYPDRTTKKHIKRHYDTIVAGVRPAGDGQPARYAADDEQLMESVPAWDVVTKMLMPSLRRSFEVDQRAISNAHRARLALAVEAFRRANGRAPRDLSELAPAYVPSVPIDPTTGQPFAIALDASGSVTGLELIARQSPAAPVAQEPAKPVDQRASSAPPSEWRVYVDDFIRTHHLDASQTAAANAVLAEMEKRVGPIQKTNGARASELRSRLARTAGQAERERLSRELAQLNKPIDDVFGQLKQRLDGLLTQAQREAASKRGGSGGRASGDRGGR